MEKEAKVLESFRNDAGAVFIALDELLRELRASDASAQKEETIHEIRVQIRKLISLVYFYKPLMRKEVFRKVKRNLKSLLKSFGAERNRNVFDRHMEKYMEKNVADKDVLREITDSQNLSLLMKEEEAMDPLTFRVRYEETLKCLMGYDGEVFREEAGDHADGFMLLRYAQLQEKFFRMEDELNYDDGRAMHELRVSAKNFYYTLRAKEESLGDLARKRADHLKAIQDISGRIHDADVHLDILSRFNVKAEHKETFQRLLDLIVREREKKISELRKCIDTRCR